MTTLRKTARPTVKDIAQRLGISHSTVSRVLNGDTRISAETTRRVWAVVEEVGYRPNIMARGLVRNRSSLIGIVVSNIRGSFFPEILAGAQQVLEKRGYSILLCSSDRSSRDERVHLETLIDKQVEGVIITPVTSRGVNADAYLEAGRHGIPLVVVGTQKRGVHVPYVRSDSELGGYLATRHLLALGHRRIGYLTHSAADLETSAHTYGLENVERFKGYCRALREYRVSSRGWIMEAPAEAVDADALLRWVGRNVPHRVTALFAYSDLLAARSMQAALAAGIRIPEELSVVGFDDLEFVSILYPPLTTVAQPKVEMGSYAAKKILNLIGQMPEDNLILTPELMVRGSTAPPPR